MPNPIPSTATTVRIVLVLALVLSINACGQDFAPTEPAQIFDALEMSGELTCTNRAVIGERTEACTSAEGDLFAVITDDPARVIRETRVEFGGPWIADVGWVIVSAGDDLDRMRTLRDALGTGELFVDIDEVPVQVD